MRITNGQLAIAARGAIAGQREGRRGGTLSCLFVLSFCAALFAACDNSPVSVSVAPAPRGTRVQTNTGAYTNIEPQELQRLLADKNFPLINVHVPYEGEIEKTDANVPFNETDQLIRKLPSDKNAMVVLYCRSGAMSRKATEALVSVGYTNVWNMDRGMVGWKETGFPIVTKNPP